MYSFDLLHQTAALPVLCSPSLKYEPPQHQAVISLRFLGLDSFPSSPREEEKDSCVWEAAAEIGQCRYSGASATSASSLID